MDIEFQLAPEDLRAFFRYHRQLMDETDRLLPRWVWGLLLGAVVSYFLAEPHFGIDNSQKNAFYLGLVIAWIVMILLLIWSHLWSHHTAVRRQLRGFTDKRNRYLYETKHLTISPEGITETGSQSFGTTRWPRIWHIGQTRDHVFFFVTLDSAVAVPRRAFPDEQQFEAFIALARQYQQGKSQQEAKSSGIITGLPPQSDAFTRPNAP